MSHTDYTPAPDICPACGKPLTAINRNPFSPVECENKHRFTDGVTTVKHREGGRWVTKSYAFFLVPVDREEEN